MEFRKNSLALSTFFKTSLPNLWEAEGLAKSKRLDSSKISSALFLMGADAAKSK
jgi:hypothetical protein